jgi:hypothetical protein
MGKILCDEYGYSYVSNSGVPYTLYKGVTIGNGSEYNSDIVFIMVSVPDEAGSREDFVDWFYGADDIKHGPDYIVKYIDDTVNEYEATHPECLPSSFFA